MPAKKITVTESAAEMAAAITKGAKAKKAAAATAQQAKPVKRGTDARPVVRVEPDQGKFLARCYTDLADDTPCPYVSGWSVVKAGAEDDAKRHRDYHRAGKATPAVMAGITDAKPQHDADSMADLEKAETAAEMITAVMNILAPADTEPDVEIIDDIEDAESKLAAEESDAMTTEEAEGTFTISPAPEMAAAVAEALAEKPKQPRGMSNRVGANLLGERIAHRLLDQQIDPTRATKDQIHAVWADIAATADPSDEELAEALAIDWTVISGRQPRSTYVEWRVRRGPLAARSQRNREPRPEVISLQAAQRLVAAKIREVFAADGRDPSNATDKEIKAAWTVVEENNAAQQADGPEDTPLSQALAIDWDAVSGRQHRFTYVIRRVRNGRTNPDDK